MAPDGSGSGMTAGLWGAAEHGFPGQRLDEFLLWAAEAGASDIAFQSGSPAFLEVDGRLRRATAGIVDRTAMELIVENLFNATGEGILRSGEAIDCSKTVQRGRTLRRRFRVNIAPVQVDHGFGVSIALRVMPEGVPEFGDLETDAEIVEAWELCTGLNLVTGIPGSGKSTLLAAGTRRLLELGVGRIQSFESPIEYVFDEVGGDCALMSSAEIPLHFKSFADGLRSSLRRRPTAVVVGEARDRKTVEAVVRAADYGIAVFSTVHTAGVAATIRRMLGEFPAEERDERGATLVDVLHLVVTQLLLINPKGGRTALREWLVFDADLKRDLLLLPQSEWPGRIVAEMVRTGNHLEAAGAKAFAAGEIDESDRLRIRASSGSEILGVVGRVADHAA